MSRRLSTRAFAAVALAVAAITGGLAGCGAGTSGSGTSTHTVTTASTSHTPTSHTSTSRAIASTTTTPTTTVVLPGTGRPQVALGDKNTPQQFILGELYDLALSAEGYTVTLTRNIGPTSVSVEALAQGTLDMYPEYLNVWNGTVAGLHRYYRTVAGAYAGGEAYAIAHGMELLTPTPFADTSGIAVTSAFGLAHHLRTLEDLRRVGAALTLGAPVEFIQDPSGLPLLEQAYGFQPAVTRTLQIGQQYGDLTRGTIEAGYVDTTDGQLAGPDYRVLRDSRHVLGFGNVVPVVPDSVIATEGPSFAATINAVSALLTTHVIRELDAEEEIDNAAPATVAREFLTEHGLLPVVPSGPT